MDPQDVIAMAMEIVLERERQNKWLMEESLRAQKVAVREKRRVRSMLKRKKQEMLAKEEAMKKLVDDFMVFIKATENNDLEIARNFDEKAMMNAIATIMNSNTGDDGGFAVGDNDLLGIGLGLEEQATMDVIQALENGVGSSGGDNRGFPGGQVGINNTSGNAQSLGEEDKITAAEGTNSEVGEGSNAGGCGNSYNGNRRK